ncbi:MAG TPA: C13 family peptidase, partial [Dokdonella sp.]
LAYAISAASWWWLPSSPLLVAKPASATPDRRDADTADATPADDADSSADAAAPEFDAEALMYAQPALLDAALAKIAPQTPGRPDLYVVAFAGDAEESVFRNEAEYAERLFSERFGAAGRVLVLENHVATVATRPLATWTNLHRALDALAKKIDPAEDILLVYLTTHGSHDHQLLVDLDPLPLDQIGPDDLADALKTEPAIRWKVVVVNACYSGGFVDAVRDDSTMVVASARADRTSFGCGADSDVTYFGKAFLVDALNRTTSFRDAFEQARRSVAAWEAAEGEEHSEPQIASSPSIEAKLASWQRTLHAGAPVPFAPADAASDQTSPAGGL